MPTATYESGVAMVEVESGDVMAMRDETATDLLDEINANRRQTSMALMLAPSLAVAGLVAMAVLGPPALLASLILGGAGWAIGTWIDIYRRTCVLFYDLESEVEQAYEDVVCRFDALAACARRWHVEAGGAVQDST
jgi:hypothetical protein